MEPSETTKLSQKATLTRQRIIDTALQLFAAKGYDQTTMRDIAAEAGCSLGLTYRYFASKEDLVLELYRWLAVQLEELVDVLPATSIADRFHHLMRELLVALHTAARGLALNPVPVAALIEGRALGGALELAICCHFIFATHDARLGCPEIKLGVLPPLFAVAAPARFGGALTERLTLTGEEIDTATAEQAGWLTQRFAAGASAEDSMRAWYRQHLEPLSAFAIREATRAIRIRSPLAAALGQPLDDSERDYMERVATSHDGNEGIDAFLEKRPPRWLDR